MALQSRLNIKKILSKLDKLGKLSKKRAVLLLALAVLFVFGMGLFLPRDDQAADKNVDCITVVNEVNKALNESDDKKAYDLAKQHEKTCLKQNDKVNNTLYYALLAITSFKEGDKEQAEVYAAKAQETGKSLTPLERSKITNYESMIGRMSDIKEGSYYGIGGLY